MGGGDLNMKKSWHPLLMKNQERVWLEEKKAVRRDNSKSISLMSSHSSHLSSRKRKSSINFARKRKKNANLQELQRLQEEQTGKKRTEKLEWMYATPATGSSQNPNDLEDYLLGKKRVDKILIGTENEKIGAAHKNFIAVQNANNARDVAAKIREDPLLAIKQQEAAAYETLMSNPLRLREMQERNGIKPSKKEKKDKKREKQERKEQRRREREERHRPRSPPPLSDYDERDHDHRRSPRSWRSLSPRDRYSRSPVDSRRFRDRDERPRPSYSPRRDGRRSRSPDSRHERRERSNGWSNGFDTGRRSAPGERKPRWPRSDESDPETRGRERSRTPERGTRHGDDSLLKRPRSRSPAVEAPRNHKRTRPSSPPRPPAVTDDRTARLAAMTSNAAEMSTERKDRLAALLEKEKAELEAEELARAKSKGMGGFLSKEQKKVFGGHGGLEERLRRSRAGLVTRVD
ncbi:Pre-mRNA splicing factor-domain-containing protein [Lactarius hatsudake]|nr:Pre-mRNA splicing factor-domain-containing protein [Lactarius hatsudake]